ncbi:isocitrate/isopropylmalate dehydrogenase family protein [Compostimonas suwonensis]|uniref:3-isopropylmalate dehydrogenase n=1 Tax=Compostimonas suwonensis TaxID=1048394 RepID=A0A2M9C387_9MICO|nr:isocitrate/isopropylmalate dehydrogenase family protein [Compostimonas suwonensis]PJJ65000.1 3-isopropylmalate dehydrogenase [Compostimonas suwonensis]
MSRFQIAVIGGDGIGPEITDQAMRVAVAAAATVGHELELVDLDASALRWLRTGVALPDEQLEAARAADAVYLGAIGLPEARHPDGREVNGDVILGLRTGLDLYAGIRPAKTYPGVPRVLTSTADIDYVVVRENVEGMFASRKGGARVGDAVVTDTLIVTRAGTERVVRHAFELARARHARRPERPAIVTVVDKSNAFASYAFFRQIFDDVAAEFPDVKRGYAYIDAMTTFQVQHPERFDVVVTENLFGDIISDLAGATVGGLGLAASADVGDDHGMFQSAHGSAPDIAGRGIANPTAAILSAALMLNWLGTSRDDEAATIAGERIDTAVAKVLQSGDTLTPDLGGSATSAQFGDAVVRAVEDDSH